MKDLRKKKFILDRGGFTFNLDLISYVHTGKRTVITCDYVDHCSAKELRSIVRSMNNRVTFHSLTLDDASQSLRDEIAHRAGF